MALSILKGTAIYIWTTISSYFCGVASRALCPRTQTAVGRNIIDGTNGSSVLVTLSTKRIRDYFTSPFRPWV